MFSITPNNGIFQGFVGNLSASGHASPSVSLPNDPSLAGLQLSFAFAVVDTSVVPADLRTFSIAHVATIQ